MYALFPIKKIRWLLFPSREFEGNVSPFSDCELETFVIPGYNNNIIVFSKGKVYTDRAVSLDPRKTSTVKSQQTQSTIRCRARENA